MEGSSQHNIRQGMDSTGASLGMRGMDAASSDLRCMDGVSSDMRGFSMGHIEGASLGINMMGNSARDRFSTVGGRVELLKGNPGPPSPPMTDVPAWAPWSPEPQSSCLPSLGSSWAPSSAWTPPSSPPIPSPFPPPLLSPIHLRSQFNLIQN